MLTYKRATSDKELYEILAIQKRNLKANTSLQDREKQGYITVPYTFDFLKKGMMLVRIFSQWMAIVLRGMRS